MSFENIKRKDAYVIVLVTFFIVGFLSKRCKKRERFCLNKIIMVKKIWIGFFACFPSKKVFKVRKLKSEKGVFKYTM